MTTADADDRAEGELRTLLMEWDPVGVAEFEQVSDEYDCMLSPLLKQLDAGAEGEQIVVGSPKRSRGTSA